MQEASERLSLARVVAGLAGVVRRNPASLGLLWLLTVTVLLLLDFARASLIHALDLTTDFPADYLAEQISNIGLGVLGGGVPLVVAADLQQGRRVDAATALATALRLSGRMLGITALTTVGVTLGTLVGGIPGIMLALRWCVAGPVRALEATTAGGALRRSEALTEGNRWRLLLLWLVLVAGSWVWHGVAYAAGVDVNPFGSLTVSRVVEAMLGASEEVLGAIGAAVCYVDLRRIHEENRPDQVAAVFT